MTKIYLDQDGVLADFNGGLRKLGVSEDFGYHIPWKDKTEHQKEMSKAVIKCMETKGFFENLPPMEGYWDLYKAAGHGSFVLTAVPGLGEGHDERVSEEKKRWGWRYLGASPGKIITCLRSEKAQYAKGNLLIDDHPKNVSEWEAAGGIGILFSNYKQAINDLNKLLKRFDVV